MSTKNLISLNLVGEKPYVHRDAIMMHIIALLAHNRMTKSPGLRESDFLLDRGSLIYIRPGQISEILRELERKELITSKVHQVRSGRDTDKFFRLKKEILITLRAELENPPVPSSEPEPE